MPTFMVTFPNIFNDLPSYVCSLAMVMGAFIVKMFLINPPILFAIIPGVF